MNHLRKKALLCGIVGLMSFSVVAQSKQSTSQTKSNVTFGVKAGATFSKFSLSGDNSVGYTSSSLPSFYVGGTVDIPLFGLLSVESGLSLIGKGSNIHFPSLPPASMDIKYSPIYLELPVNLVLKQKLGPGSIFIGAGPYLSFGLGGKIKVTTVDLQGILTVDKDGSLQFGSDTSKDIKSTDFGLNVLLGYQLKNGLNIHGGYGLGLTNINPEPTAPTSKNTVISVGLGYSF